jgi:enoyl-CoA hydratase
MAEDFNGFVDRSQLPGAETVVMSIDGPVGLIEMNEPERLNPLGANEMHIHYALLELHANTDVRCVIITGRGRAFCAGADIRGSAHATDRIGHDELGWSDAQRLAYKYAFGNMWETLYHFSKPTIAAVNGYALGGGWEVAHMCDFVIAADTAIFGAVEIDIGLPPFANTLPYLAKMVGKHRAMDLTINGRKFDAAQAYEWGLVNKVVPLDDLMTEARSLAEEISTRPPVTVAAIRQIINKSLDLMEHYELERAWAYFLRSTNDYRAARAAISRREPRPEFDAS